MTGRLVLPSIADLGLQDGVDATGLRWLGERCKSDHCKGRRCVVTMVVRDEDWQAVVDGEGVLCPACFDIEAQRRGVAYEVVAVAVVPWTRWHG